MTLRPKYSPAREAYRVAKERFKTMQPGEIVEFRLPESAYWRTEARLAISNAALHVWGKGYAKTDTKTKFGWSIVTRLTEKREK